MAKKTRVRPCPICGEPEPSLGHALVAHGPLAKGAKLGKRKKVRDMLPYLHSRLEKAGFDELQSHLIIRVVREFLREKGIL